MATNMVTRKVRHKNADGTVIEADIGALAENVTEDANHRFVTDAEKEAWNNKPDADDIDLSTKVDKQGGDISNTVVSTFNASAEEFPVPAAGEAPKTFMGKVKKFFEDFNNIRAGLLTLGQIVNNCTSDRSDLPLAAAQGKALMDQITELNNNKIQCVTHEYSITPTKDGFSHSLAPVLRVQTGGRIIGAVFLGYAREYNSATNGTGTVSVAYHRLAKLSDENLEGHIIGLNFSKAHTDPVIVRIGILYQGDILQENW